MTLRSLLSGLALAALALLPVRAQDAPRFAYFIPEQVVQSSVRAKQVFAELEVAQKNLSERVKVKAEELQKMEQQLKSPGLSDEGRARIQRDLQDGETSFKRLREDSEAEFRKVQEKCFGQFNQEVRPIIDALAKEQKLQAVMNFQAAGIVYAEDGWLVAFSTEVAKRYDAKYAAGAAPAEKAPAAAKPAAKPAKK